MHKDFSFIKDGRLADVMSIALGEDEGSSSVSYRYIQEQKRLWLVRSLHNDRRFRYLECFEFQENKKRGWGFRGWSEEEVIPFLDCPLDLLSQANGSMVRKWRLSVLAYHGLQLSIPRNAWIHSISGVRISGGRISHDFQHISDGYFRTADGEVYQLKPQAVARIMQEGFGIAIGRA